MIRDAGGEDADAWEGFGRGYRRPVLDYISGRVGADDAEDLCQEVFVRLFRGKVLKKADRDRGRFRSLLLTVVRRVIQDWFRRRRPMLPLPDLEPAERDPDFDRAWAVHLTERAMRSLKEQRSPYFDVLQQHLTGESVNRNKLWIARGKLSSLIRKEIALTCRTAEEAEEEVAYLSRYLRPSKQADTKEF